MQYKIDVQVKMIVIIKPNLQFYFFHIQKKRNNMIKGNPPSFFYKDNPPEIRIDSAQSIGSKDVMEDFIVPGQGTVHFCAVLDGHGGHNVASGLAVALTALLPGTILVHGLEKIVTERKGETLCSILKRACEITENQVPISVFSRCGTTIVCVLAISCPSVPPGEWHLSWASVGDSSIFFIPCDGIRPPYKVTTDHNHLHPLEKERCVGNGGMFNDQGYLMKKKGPADYGLSMTRSIGDKVLSDAGLIDTPDAGMLYIMNGDRVVLVSDGVTDALPRDNPNAIVVFMGWINPYLFESPAKNTVVESTRLFGNNADNATCIIMNF